MNAPDPSDILEKFKPLFEPRTIAVAGASQSSTALGNRFINTLQNGGFGGKIYPIHPSARKIEGLPAYISISALPEPVDYAYVAIKASQVIPFLRDAKGRIKFAQVLSSGFSETQRGKALEEELIKAGRTCSIRIIGPNCIGLHAPRGKMALIDDSMQTMSGVGFLSQSGGLSLDVLRRGKVLGLPFSAVVSLGNCADVGPTELLEYLLADPETKVIGLYLEMVRNGRRFFELLSQTKATKPVIILKGGKTEQGRRAAASHTGSLTDDNRLWSAVIRQAGAIEVEDLDSMMAHLMAIQSASPALVGSSAAILFGNGGGTSVIATDQFASHGIEVPALEKDLYGVLEKLELPDGASIENPIDVPANILLRNNGRQAQWIIDSVRTHDRKAALVVHLNLAVFSGYKQPSVIAEMIDTALLSEGRRDNPAPFHLVLRSDGDEETEALKRILRSKAIAVGIPVFNELKESAHVLSSLNRLALCRYRHTRQALG